MKSKPKPADAGLPTVEQLASIAATLARNSGEAPEALVNSAMRIWLATRRRIKDAEEDYEIEIHDYACNGSSQLSFSEAYFRRHYDFYPDGQPPITRDQILCAVLPQWKDRPHELARIAKEYIRDVLLERHGEEPTLEAVAGAFASWKSFDEPMEAVQCGERLSGWHDRHKREVRRAAGSKSARIKAAKKKTAAVDKLKKPHVRSKRRGKKQRSDEL